MKLELQTARSQNLFTGYGANHVLVNRVRYTANVIVTPEEVVMWKVAGFEQLAAGDFEALLRWTPEIVIFGTGSIQRFPHPRLTHALAAARIGLEVMDTGAACRTYNFLLAEDRRVIAAVLLSA